MSISYKDISKLRMWIGGIFGPINYVDFDMSDLSATYHRLETVGDDEFVSETKFNKDSFLSKIEKMDLLNWEKSYVDDNFRDGTQWYVDIQFSDGSDIEISGSNAYPENYDELRILISKIVHQKFA